jgi:hypothetical protein
MAGVGARRRATETSAAFAAGLVSVSPLRSAVERGVPLVTATA